MVYIMDCASHLGEIRVQRDNSLDFEESPQIQLVVLADNGLQTAHCKVSISLLDVNDNAPVFEQDSYRTAVWEGQAHNTYIMQVEYLRFYLANIRNNSYYLTIEEVMILKEFVCCHHYFNQTSCPTI